MKSEHIALLRTLGYRAVPGAWNCGPKCPANRVHPLPRGCCVLIPSIVCRAMIDARRTLEWVGDGLTLPEET